MDPFHKILKAIDYRRWTYLGLLAAFLVPVIIFGCSPKVESLREPGEKVPIETFDLQVMTIQQELKNEIAEHDTKGTILDNKIDLFNEKVDAGYAGYEKKVASANKLINILGGVATKLLTGGTVDIVALLASGTSLAIGLGGYGASRDKKRTDKILLERKKNT